MKKKQFTPILILCLISMILWNCTGYGGHKQADKKMNLKKEIFGETNGKKVFQYTLTNENNMKVKILNYGGIVTHLFVPDKTGKLSDVVLGYDSLQNYLDDTPYFGAIVGRYGNRIAKGTFTIDDQKYHLALNDGTNSLHGGIKGFDKVVWDANDFVNPDNAGIVLTYISPDGDEGFPGNLKVKVTYTLTNNDELKINYEAATDKATVVNLTHHSYFNLTGGVKTDILNHELWINADKMTPVDEGLIPTGIFAEVAGTPFDFTKPTKIGARIEQENLQLTNGGGYDHNWCLNDVDGSLKRQASLYDETSGRYMEIFTQEPGLQFYSGNFLDGSNVGKGGKVYAYRNGLCLETQHFPDSPNQTTFPNTILQPGERYETKTVYKFSTK